MGRRFVAVSELQDVADTLRDCVNRVDSAIKSLNDAKMPQAHLSIDAVAGTYLRKTADWAIELPAKVEVEIKRRAIGQEPQSVIDQKRNAKAAKKRKAKP